MKIKLFFISFILLFFIRCSSTPKRVLDPNTFPYLRGYIKPNKIYYNINEPIEVKYVIVSNTDNIYEEEVIDGSADPSIPFQGYSFNAVKEDNKLKHLILKKSFPPIKGKLFLKPDKEKVFTKNIFEAKEKGNYILSFRLYWKNNKEIKFKPVTIIVYSKKETEQEIDPLLKKALLNLKSDNYKIRMEARKTIEKFGKQGAKVLIPLLKSEDTKIRSEALFTLIEMKEKSIDVLIKNANNPNREIRMRVIYALGQIGGKKVIPVLRRALFRDRDKEIRGIALKMIDENFIDLIAIPLFIRALSDESLEIRKLAINFLRKRTKLNFGFIPEASKTEREKVIKKWKEWWKNIYKGSEDF